MAHIPDHCPIWFKPSRVDPSLHLLFPLHMSYNCVFHLDPGLLPRGGGGGQVQPHNAERELDLQSQR